MGILNVTPDSFSDGGLYSTVQSAVDCALKMIDEGADIIDIGGESTRPGSLSISVDEELNRVVPVIEALRLRSGVRISVDTTKVEVAEAALCAGAEIVNDVSMMRHGDSLARAVACHDATLVLMHSRHTPRDMQENVHYEDLLSEVIGELRASVDRAVGAGVHRDKIWLDPGIGFSKTASQNLELMRRLSELTALGYPVLVGPSRKSFIGRLTDAGVNDRLGGTAAAVALCVAAGASVLRVHDVFIMRQTAIIAAAISRGSASEVIHHV